MEFINFHRSVPTYENGNWTITEYDNIEDFRVFVLSTFKEPGKYDFDEISNLFNEQSRIYIKQGVYCTEPHISKKFIK